MNDAEQMKQIRTKLGLTQSAMADRLGYSGQKDISRIENGHRQMSQQVRKHLETIEQYVLK